MEFSIDKQALLKELALLQGVVERKNTIPILSNILIESRDARLRLTATDLEVTVETLIEGVGPQPGAWLLPARKLFDIVRSLPEGEIFFSQEEANRVKITSGQSRFRLSSSAREHFPSTIRPRDFDVATSAKNFAQAISRIIFAISHEESRYAINGALFDCSNGFLKMVATDGHRLAVAQVPVERAVPLKVVVPRKALSEVLRLVADSEEIEFSSDENHIFFKAAARQLSARLLAGAFPNYEAVIPQDFDRVVKIQTEVLAGAIRRAAIMADLSRAIRLQFEPERLTIHSSTSDLGEVTEVVPVEQVAAPTEASLEVGFNAEYLLDFLMAAGSAEVTMSLREAAQPVLMEPVETVCNYKYVVMPMRL
jgi:DNA polymerase-3 subunit beta